MPDQNPTVPPVTTKAQSITSTLNRNIEIFSLTPSTLLTLWEIDASAVVNEGGLSNLDDKAVFRFHNSVKLMSTTITWNGQDYTPCPIQAQGFEYTAKGSPPTPKLTLAVNDEGAPLLSRLKSRIKELNDLTGVKVTRRRVFAKYIDGSNFETISAQDFAGQGFTPDPNMHFEPDVYFIDRKSLENKSVIEFELGSITDVEGIKLPGRIVAAKRCPFQYRGFGCLYESNANRVIFVHGDAYDPTNNPAGSILPQSAPPVANYNDEKISDILGGSTSIKDTGIYVPGIIYAKGDSAYLLRDGIKYYFVSLQNANLISPPNPLFWIADSCAKNINSCRMRWAHLPGSDGSLPYGGYPSVLTAV